MKRLLGILLAATCVATGLAQEPAANSPIFEQIDVLTSELVRMTGLEAKRKVDYAVIDREELKSYLEQKVQEEIKPEVIRVEELLLKKFGFVPQNFDLKRTMIDLYAEQAAAFYDYRKKKLFMLASGDKQLQEVALLHELAHALADQHFRLERYLDRAGENDDGALARMAVMEGQATWLMSEYMVQRGGKSLVDAPEMASLMSRMVAASSGQFPVFDEAPLYIRESLMFPYTLGMTFQQAVVERMGKDAFSEVFRRPPVSTREIMQPEAYFERHRRKRLKLPRLRKEGRYEKLAEGVLGEFDFAVMLQQHADENATRRIAPEWRAGSYRLFEHKKDQRTVLAHVSEWSSKDNAREFFQFYRTALDGKWEEMKIDGESGDAFAGEGDDGYFAVRIAGTVVYSVEGMRSPDEVRRWPQP